MTGALSRLARRARRRSPLILALVLLLAGTGIWILSADARRAIDAMATANSDSTQWSLAQSEVEFLAFESALLRARADDPESLRALRLRFDVFYSRINILHETPSFDDILALPEVATALGRIEDYLTASLPFIDGRDAELAAALGSMTAGSATLRQELRAISLAGVRVFAERSARERERVARALWDLAILTIGLFGFLLAFVLALARALEVGRQRTALIDQTRGRLRTVVAASLDAILLVDRAGKILEFNGAARRVFGHAPGEAIGRPIDDLLVFDAPGPAGLAQIGEGLSELRARHRDGRSFPVELSVSRAESEEGEVLVCFIRDISERDAAKRDLVEARDRALAGEKAKAQLLAVMSHEMRTPLNGMIGSLEILSGTALDPRQSRLVGAMETSGRMLLDHVNAVLDVSRIDASASHAAREAFDLGALVDGVAESLRAQAEARGNSLALHGPDPGLGRVIGDAARLRQVLINLLGNAVKFTRDGRITVEHERHPGTDDVEIRLIDTGIGIEEADQARIFEDFVTLDTAYDREVEGTGLGLGIVRRLVAVMGGEIGVESTPGEGSVFWLRLPLPPAATPARSPAQGATPPSAPRPGLRVLVIEDNEINRLVAREMLADLGAEVTEAPDGAAGLAEAESRAFDLILMDISMPRLDGVEATRRLRTAGGPNRDTPVVALTAHVLPEDLDRFRAAGLTDVLVKPVTRRGLAEMLEALAGARPGARPPAPTPPLSAWDELRATLGDETANGILARARVEIAAALDEIERRAGAPEPDRPGVASLAHKAAGLAAIVGLDETRHALVAIEDKAPDVPGSALAPLLARARDSLRAPV